MAKHALALVDERIVSTSPVLNTEGEPSGLENINPGVPTQIANPSRASWRTFLQAVIPFLVMLNLLMPLIQQFLVDNIEDATTILGPVYPYVVLGVNILVVLFSLVSKLIALIMANPTVNDWITKHLSFLSPIPVGDADHAIVGAEEIFDTGEEADRG